ncbi:uncharacterized protein LOC124807917 isoform X1 [Hydra vulgaris]|uniref:uncharacterized protein LOC124807917 isoform X1 n=1 Tax=Hydra vulgaris TaxID=6087 RepID=UPI001F5ECE0A|nr:uncharacterized protein LOC124807917 [Hydra vulgaris]
MRKSECTIFLWVAFTVAYIYWILSVNFLTENHTFFSKDISKNKDRKISTNITFRTTQQQNELNWYKENKTQKQEQPQNNDDHYKLPVQELQIIHEINRHREKEEFQEIHEIRELQEKEKLQKNYTIEKLEQELQEIRDEKRRVKEEQVSQDYEISKQKLIQQNEQHGTTATPNIKLITRQEENSKLPKKNQNATEQQNKILLQNHIVPNIKLTNNESYTIQMKYNQQEKYENNEDTNKSAEKLLEKCKISKIFIWSIGRSGSTIMGSLFNIHPDVVYYYEPLHDLYRQHKWIYQRLYGTENRTEILYTAISKIDDIFNQPLKTNKCNHIVIKELHPKLPGGLIRFSANSRHTIKFIHLIRDPRPALNSMLYLKWFQKSDLAVVAENLCQATLKDFKYGSTYMSKNIYHMIKYEELCTNLTYYVERLLNFTQLKPSTKLNEYVAKIQQRNNGSVNAYDTERNLKVQLINWRKNINIDVVNTIEKYCFDMMNILGYKHVNGNLSLLRNLSITLH